MDPYKYYRNDELLDEEVDRDRQVQRYVEEAVAFIDRSKDQPFFLYLAHAMPHTPLQASPEFRGKSERGLYGDAVSEVDWSVGQVMAKLREHQLDKNTLVIFFSDNGGWLARGENGGCNHPLRSGKGSTYEGGVRVPCVAWQPGFVPEGSTCSELATAMDLLPTFAELARAPRPTDRVIDGKSIVPLLRGEKTANTPHDRFYYYFGNELHSVRSGRWKLRAENILANESIYNKEWRDVDAVVPAALYDLRRDPSEQKSVMRDHPRITKRLEKLLESARADLGDSLTGVEPSGAREIGRQDRPRSVD
jgi:arylsulfatase